MKRTIFALIYLSGLLVMFLTVNSFAEIIPADRRIDWSNVGIPGGIPNRTTICATIDAATYGNGTTDATAGIQSALNSCPANQVVLLSAGTFRINSSLSVPSNVTLRGAGAQQTILNAQGSGNSVIRFGSDVSVNPANSTPITNGATAGSQSITVSSATGITVGSYLMITELNDPSIVNTTGSEGACSWCDGSMWGGTRVRGQIVEVATVNGTTVSFTPALYSAYPNTPLATRFTAGAKYAGAENLQVYANNTGYSANWDMTGSAYCWIKGVEDNYADGDHVRAWNAFRGEIRDSYFSNAFSHGPGGTDADVVLAIKTSGFLVENNIFERLHASIMAEWGAAGNVFSYNYSTGNFDSSGSNVLMQDFNNNHGAHPQFNLWEGNISAQFRPDNIWGSSSHSTAFRNWALGTTKICDPTTDQTRAPVNWSSCHWAVQANRAISIDAWQLYYNLVGNVAGSAEMAALLSLYGSHQPLGQVPMVLWPANRSYDGNAYGYSFGYGTVSDNGTQAYGHALSYNTVFIHGDYNNVNSTITWADGVTHTLPASLYKSSKPSWFGNIPWPAIGPDVSGGSGPGGHAYDIPAKVCYDKTPKDANGLLIFNANNCYAAQTTILYGDVSENGTVSAYDASLAAQYAVGSITLTSSQITKADVSGNGSVTAYDASLIAQRAVGLIDKFPVEG